MAEIDQTIEECAKELAYRMAVTLRSMVEATREETSFEKFMKLGQQVIADLEKSRGTRYLPAHYAEKGFSE